VCVGGLWGGGYVRGFGDSHNAHECDIMIVGHAANICYKIGKLQHLAYTEQHLLQSLSIDLVLVYSFVED